MAKAEDIALVKINLQESRFPMFTDEDIELLLDRYQSIPRVSYLLALQKAQGTAVVLGPVELKSDADYWNKMADVFWRDYQEELAKKARDESLTSTGSTFFMRRADGQ